MQENSNKRNNVNEVRYNHRNCTGLSVIMKIDKRGNAENIFFSIDQYDNPDSIVYRPGGRFDEGRIMIGEISTISNSPMSLQLIRAFEKCLKKNCKKIQGYYVSKEIMGKRI